MSEQLDIRIAFVDSAIFDNGAAMRGGALITDIETRPFEFRCTSPVRPTVLQRTLYGNTLDEYIHVELIGVPLVKAAKEIPSLVLVKNPLLLRMRPKLQFPVVLIQRDTKSVVGEANGEGLRPVVISAHRDFSGETAAAQAMLAPLMQRHDLLEPFDRLQVALSEAHKQRIGDSATGNSHA